MATLTAQPALHVELSIRSRHWTDSRRESDRPTGRSRVYVWLEDETLLDNLRNRRQRPYNAWRPIVEATLRERGIAFTSLRWSQRCGCSCPCSPGFIIEGAPLGVDYYLTLRAGSEA